MRALETLLITIGALLLLLLLLGLLGMVAIEVRWITSIWTGDTKDRRS
ncbi:MAG TPA: hypothetical protein VGC06_03235 [Actinomycetes bacterium]